MTSPDSTDPPPGRHPDPDAAGGGRTGSSPDVRADHADHGLTSAQVADRVARGEVNVLGEGTSRSVVEIIRANVLTRFNAILGALFVFVIATGSFADALFGLILIVNSAIGIVQEWLAKRKLDRLALLHAPTTRVRRDGTIMEIPTSDVVLDDLIELRTGDEVPADGPLLVSDGLELNESNLTGESDPVPHGAGDEIRSGTSVVAGAGRFHATAVGEKAYVNTIAADARRFTRTHSEIQTSINTLLRYITWVLVIAVPLQLWSQWRAVGDDGWREVVIRSAGGLVGLVPEGLVLLTSVAFLLSAVMLTRSQVLVQQLPAVEGLARVDVVCLDKTGTLTVGDIVFGGLDPLPGTDEEESRAALGALADDLNANGTLVAIGNAIDPPGWTRDSTIPFNSARKWSAASFADHGTWILGAPEVLLDAHGDHSARGEIRGRVAELAATGQRVVLLARSDHRLTEHVLPDDLMPAAVVTLREQIRPDARETLDWIRSQDVTVKVISGDNPETVGAIAREVGLDVDEPVDARSLPDDQDALREALAGGTVFGRVTPEQKRAFVHALQADGHVVAMTGDGVNDALALKDADIGVAMGNGAQATKAVAELVLLDSRFSHFPKVIAEGRRVIGNVERVANLFVAKNAMSLVAIVVAAVLVFPFPLLPRHLTLVSTVTIGIPAFFLALGPNRRRYTPGFLRRILWFAVPAGFVAGAAVMITYLVGGRRYGVPWEDFTSVCTTPTDASAPVDIACWQPGTGATITLLTVFFWILVVLSRPMKAWKAALIGSMVTLATLAFALPAGRRFFAFNAPAPLVLLSLGVGVLGAVAIELLYRRSRSVSAGTPHHLPEQDPPRRMT